MARPRKSLPTAAEVLDLLGEGLPWKVVEIRTGVSRRTILRRVLPAYCGVLPRSRGCGAAQPASKLAANDA